MHILTSQDAGIDVPKEVLQGVGMRSGQGVHPGLRQVYLIEWQGFVVVWLIVGISQWTVAPGGGRAIDLAG
jgi:hypothetical protein